MTETKPETKLETKPETKLETKSMNTSPPSLSLADEETLPWTKNKENIQILGSAFSTELKTLLRSKQARLQLTEEFERAIATLATRQPKIAERLQAAADEKLFRDKAKKVWTLAKDSEYDKCMELIEGESDRLINIAYDGLIYAAIRALEDDLLARLGKLLDEWIARVGPYKVHCRSLHYIARRVDNHNREQISSYFALYESKKVQSIRPTGSLLLLQHIARRKDAGLTVQVAQKWGHSLTPNLIDHEILPYTENELKEMQKQCALPKEELDKLHPGRIRCKDGNEKLWSQHMLRFKDKENEDDDYYSYWWETW